IREQINRRMDGGESGEALLTWINGLPEARQVLEGQFEGAPVSKQNLSEWRQGGFEDWLRHRESLELVREMDREGAELDGAAERALISDRLGTLLAVELARVSRTMLSETTGTQERWECLRGLLRELKEVRREDHRAARLRMARERQEWVVEERERKEEKDRQQEEWRVWTAGCRTVRDP